MLRMRNVVVAIFLAVMPLTAHAAQASEPVLSHLTDLGDAISLGFGVTPLRPQLTPPRPAPADLSLTESTALSFDLKLKWPGSDVTSSLQPYLMVGPALFVVEPDYLSRMLGTRVDPNLRLGGRAGAGVDWHLGKDVTFFGAWETTGEAASPKSRAPGESGVTGFDFTYGLRLRY
jgi:hypothetical protein